MLYTDTRHRVEGRSKSVPNTNPTVLVVDDREEIRLLIRELLTPYGVTIQEASSGEEALLGLQLAIPDLVLLDVMMPGLDGIETLGEIRRQYGTEVPVFIVTARANSETLKQAKEMGANGFVAKPFDPPRFIRKVLEKVQP